MADIALTYSNNATFKETALNNGSIANGITITVADGTFAGDNGDSLLGDGLASVTGVPTGLTAVLVKTSATTARLTFKGTAEAHENANDIAAATDGLVLRFDQSQFATGTGGDAVSAKAFAIDFNNKVTTGLTLVPEAGVDVSETFTAGSTKTGAKDNLPTIGGVGTKDSTLYFYSNGKIIDKTVSTKVGSDGAWSYDLSGLAAKFKDGAHVVTVSTSADGKGAMSAPFAFTVDSKAPSAPSVTVIKGAISDVTPVLTGKAEKGATVKVYSSDEQRDNAVGDKAATLLGETVADAKGIWTLAVDSDNTLLTKDGGYKISALAIDAAGNQTASKVQAKDNLVIDTTIDTPTLAIDATKSKGSTVALGGKVEGETGGTVQLYGGADGSVPLGKVAKIGKDGAWKMTLKLSEGDHDLSVIATDAAGNISANSTVEKKTIDTATAVPTLELAEKEGKDWVTMYGTAEAGATVTVKNGTATLGETKADSNGKWVMDTFTGTIPTKDGTAKLTATAKDTAGNISKASAPADEFKVNTKFEDKAAPTLLFAETSTDGKTVVLTYSQALAAATAEKTAYDVIVGTTTIEPTSVASSGAKVTLTLTDAIKAGETVKVTYTAPAETDVKADDKAIQDKAGNNAITLTDQAVTNLVPATEESGGGGGADTTAPAFVSAATNADGTQIILTYSEALGATTAAAAAFDIVINGAPAIDPSTATVSGSTVVLALASALKKTDVVTVAYTAPTADNTVATNAAVQDTAGNDAEALAAKDVTNNTVDAAVTEIDSVAVTSATELTVTMTGTDAVNAQVMNSGVVVIAPVEFSGSDTVVLTMTPQTNLVAAGTLMVELASGDSAVPGEKVTLGTAGDDTITVPDWGYVFTFGGADILQFGTANNSVVIADYTLAEDSIQLSKDAFTALTTTTGALTADEFASVANAAALNGGTVADSIDAQQIIYLQETGELYYNADGANAGGLTLIGTFTGSPALVVGEFTVIA